MFTSTAANGVTFEGRSVSYRVQGADGVISPIAMAAFVVGLFVVG